MSLKLCFDKKRNDYYKKHDLEFWDCVYYENNTPFELPLLTFQTIFLSAKKEFEKMASLKQEDFLFETSNNKEFDRFAKNEFDILETEEDEISKDYLDFYKIMSQEQFTKNHFLEYKNLVSILTKSDFPMSFKAVMLNEFLTQTYTQNFENEHQTMECHKRDLKKSIRGTMNLDKHCLDFVFQNAKNYENFLKLYFDSQNFSKKEIVKQQQVLSEQSKTKKNLGKSTQNLDIVSPNTFGLGQWIKFSSKKSDRKNFEQTAQNLESLFKGTISCLDHNAKTYLANDTICVFVDTHNNPQIVVCPEGKQIFEVHGMIEGQTIDEKYLDVALSFLSANKEVPSANLFFNIIKENKNLCDFIHKIENGTFGQEDVLPFSKTLKIVDKSSLAIEGKNAHAKKAISLLPKIENFTKENQEKNEQAFE